MSTWESLANWCAWLGRKQPSKRQSITRPDSTESATQPDAAQAIVEDSYRTEIVVFLVWLIVFFGLTRFSYVFASRTPDHEHLGAEYFCIARAIVESRGFSDPFCAHSGPTSWMPPLFSLILAGLLWLLKTRAAVAVAIAAATNVSYAIMGTIVYRVARRHFAGLSPWAICAAYLAWLCVFYPDYFLLSHDVWIVSLVVSCGVLTISTFIRTGRLNPWRWGLAGGTAALCSPSFTMAWAIVSIVLIWRYRRQWRSFLTALALTAMMATPWTLRNALVFHRFIPTKSNLPYDAYQANNVDADGVYDDGSFWQHPFVSIAARMEYARLGETRFVDQHGASFRESVKSNPGQYLKRVFNRSIAATVRYPDNETNPALPLLVTRRVFYVLPFLGAALSLSTRKRASPLVKALRNAYLAFLAPYALFAFYVRHLFAITPILVILVLFLAHELRCRWHAPPTMSSS